MDACVFDSFVNRVADLSSQQCTRLLALLKEAIDKVRAVDVIQQAVAGKLCCPRCSCTCLYRHGEANGLQRFRCRACARTFNALTGTPLARLRHKSKWLDYLECMLASRTLLVTDANAAYRAFTKEAGIAHACVNLRAGVRVDEHLRGAVHVQNVNSYHSRFHGWLRGFNGVATRYLPNYLGWRWAIDQERIRSPETLLKAAIGVFNS